MENKKIVHIMVGAPGAGKTTYLKEQVANLDQIISRDKIRLNILIEKYKTKDNIPKNQFFSLEDTVIIDFYKQIYAKLIIYDEVWIDSTNISVCERLKMFLRLPEEIKIELIYIKTSLEKLKERNKARPLLERTPDLSLSRIFFRLEVPTMGEDKRIYNIKTIDTSTKVDLL